VILTNSVTFNVSNEIVLNGEQINFINVTYLDANNLNPSPLPADIYILPIIEYLNVNPTDTNYKDVFYFNETDCWDINKLLKDTQLNFDDYFSETPTAHSNPSNASSNRVFNIFGFPINNYSTASPPDFGFLGLRFPVDQIFHIFNTITGSPFYTKLKYNDSVTFKIKYTGKKNVAIRISFLITTNPPNIVSGGYTTFWNNFPKIYFTTPGSPSPGDIIFDISTSFFAIKNGPTFNSNTEIIEFLSPGIKALHTLGFFNSDSVPNSPYIDYKNLFIFCNSVKKENPYKKNISYFEYENKFNEFTKDKKTSFQLLRTNPKLAGNIKLVMDSNENVYLDTFDVKESLTNEKLKKIRVFPDLDLAQNIKRAFKTLEPSDLFYFYEKNENYNTSTLDHTKQYDFTYASGPRYLKTRLYDESFSYFAPLYLKDRIPNYFVIFKFKDGFSKDTYKFNDVNKVNIQDIILNSSIIKVYDIKNSDLGIILEKHLTKLNESFNYPYYIGFKDNNLIFGIDYKNGVLTSKIFNPLDYFTNEKLVLEFNNFFVESFEKYGLLSANIINIEFLFDDDISNDYEMNGYFGLYLDTLDFGELQIDFDGFKDIKNEPKPIIGYNYDFDSDVEFIQSNDENIELPIAFYEESGTAIRTSLTNLPLEKFINGERIFAVKDKKNNLHKINKIKKYKKFEILKSFESVVLDKNKINISDFTGVKNVIFQERCEYLDSQVYSQLIISFDETSSIQNNEKFVIEYKDNFSSNIIKYECIALGSQIDEGDCFDFINYDVSSNTYRNYFSVRGSIYKQIDALVKCLDKFQEVQSYFKVKKLTSNKIIIYLNRTNVELKFKRGLVTDSDLNLVTFFDTIKYQYGKNVNLLNSTNTNILESYLELDGLNEDKIFKEFKIKIIGVIGTNLIKCNFYINGGFTYQSVWVNAEIIETTPVYTLYKIKVNNNPKITLFVKFAGSNFFNLNDTLIFKHSGILETNFIGFSKHPLNSVKIKKESFDLIKNSDIYFKKQKNKLEQIKEHSFLINGNEYKVLGLNDFDDNYRIIQLKNDALFLKSTEKILTGYSVHRPILSLFSFYRLKDFSYDLLFSEYSYIPYKLILNKWKHKTITLNPGEESELLNNCGYEITEGKVKLYGLNSVTNTWEYIQTYPRDYITPTSIGYFNTSKLSSNFLANLPSFLIPSPPLKSYNYFNTYENSYTFNFIEDITLPNKNISKVYNTTQDGYTPTTDFNYQYNNFVLYKKYTKFKIKNISSAVAVVNNIHLKYDNEYLQFRGLYGLKDFETLETIKKVETFIQQEKTEKFYFGFLDTEYKRLEELKNKDYAYLSRVAPFITRFASPGTDCRGNNYSLNLSESFNNSNFAPTETQDKKENSFEYEWFLLENIPNYISDFSDIREHIGINLNDIAYNNKTYLECLENDLNKDWFSIIFNKGYGTELNQTDLIKNNIYENYSYFETLKDLNYSIFKGVKYSFYEINENKEKITPFDIKEYKISSLLHIEYTTNDDEIGKVTYKIIRNKKYKTILILIVLKIDLQDSRFLYGISYDNFYYFKNLYNFISQYNNLPQLDYAYSSFYFPHFIEFEKSINATDGCYTPTLGHTQNPFIFDFTGVPYGISSPYTFKYISNENLKNKNILYSLDYENIFFCLPTLKLRYDLLKDLTGHPIKYTSFIQSAKNDYCVNIKLDDSKNQPIEDINIGNKTIKLHFQNYNTYYSNINILYKFPVFDINNFLLISQNKNKNLYSLYNGFDTLKNIITNISYSAFKTKLNLIYNNFNTDLINTLNFEFITLNEDDNKTYNDFVLKINEDEIISINSKTLYAETIEYNNIMNDGKKRIKSSQTNIKINLLRKSGFYEAKFKDIFEYKLIDGAVSDYYKINLFKLNTSFYFNSNFGTIQNLFYLKYGVIKFKSITKNGITQIISDIPNTKYYTLNTRNYNIFNTNYDFGYYINNVSNTVNPINSLIFYQKESPTIFMGKLYNIPKKYILNKFNYYSIFTPFVKGTKVFEITIDINSEILKNITDNNGLNYWKNIFTELNIQNANPEEIGKNYIKENILELFKIKEVFVYYKVSNDYQFDFNEKPIDAIEWKTFKTNIDGLNLKIIIEDKSLLPKTFYFKVDVEEI
jgi:hypothetical protein